MGIAHEVPRDGIFLTAEQWEQIQLSLMAIKNIELAICQKSLVVGSNEASELLDIHPNTLRTWYDEGKLPKNVGKGKHLKFERAAIERLAKAIKSGRTRKAV